MTEKSLRKNRFVRVIEDHPGMTLFAVATLAVTGSALTRFYNKQNQSYNDFLQDQTRLLAAHLDRSYEALIEKIPNA